MSLTINDKATHRVSFTTNSSFHLREKHSPVNASVPVRFLRILTATASIISLYILLNYLGVTVPGERITNLSKPCTKHEAPSNSPNPELLHSNPPKLVPLEAHIMSKCPDARDCLRDLIVPAMERISSNVDFRLSFIGT